MAGKKKIKIIFSDFDGTLTFESKFRPSEIKSVIFDVFALVRQRGWELILVSGRPLTWGHFFLSHFPVDTAIMEGGGMVLTTDKSTSMIKESCTFHDDEIIKLRTVTHKFQHEFPELPLSVDSWGRKTDRAIDLATLQHMEEDSRRLLLERVMQFFKREGVSHTLSSIHINFWIGEVSKAKGVKHYLKIFRPEIHLDECLFFGDAKNDESMFSFLKNTVGVSNIKEYLPMMEAHPAVILEGPQNQGGRGVFHYLSSFKG